MIAAIARAHGAGVVTRDTGDFDGQLGRLVASADRLARPVRGELRLPAELDRREAANLKAFRVNVVGDVQAAQ